MTHQGILHRAVLIDQRAQADDRVLDVAPCADDCAVPQDGVADLSVSHLAGGQEARHRVDGGIKVIEAARKRVANDEYEM